MSARSSALAHELFMNMYVFGHRFIWRASKVGETLSGLTQLKIRDIINV